MSFAFFDTPAFSVIVIFCGLAFLAIAVQIYVCLSRRCCYKEDLESQIYNLELSEPSGNIDKETCLIMAAQIQEEKKRKAEAELKKIKPLFTFSPVPEIKFVIGENQSAYILSQKNLEKTAIFPTSVIVNFFYCSPAMTHQIDMLVSEFEKLSEPELPPRQHFECGNGHAFNLYCRYGAGKSDDGPTQVQYVNLVFGLAVDSKNYGRIISRDTSMLFRSQQFKSMVNQLPTVLSEFKKRSSLHKLIKNHKAHSCGVCSVSDSQLGEYITWLIGWLVGWLVG